MLKTFSTSSQPVLNQFSTSEQSVTISELRKTEFTAKQDLHAFVQKYRIILPIIFFYVHSSFVNNPFYSFDFVRSQNHRPFSIYFVCFLVNDSFVKSFIKKNRFFSVKMRSFFLDFVPKKRWFSKKICLSGKNRSLFERTI